jgi:1-deoxy-D-xylulose-5-phosphate reductoisomerase
VKRIGLFGATGSIGRSTLDLVLGAPEAFAVDVVTAGRDWRRLAAIARRVGAKMAIIADEAGLAPLAQALAGTGCAVAAGAPALVEAARAPFDLMVAGITGAAGMHPVLAALDRGADVALANKEALVCAGDLMLAAARRSGGRLLPIDSEHNAIFQVIEPRERVRRIVLTASGGPFRAATLAEMAAATPEAAVRHPNWSMGAKISVDSATLMNKGLELIEGFYLFGVAREQMAAIVHPQSVVHGMVEMIDGSVLAQLGPADMRVPIAHALAWPERMATTVPPLDLAAIGRLDFEEPDRVRFPALALAEAALAAGGCRPCVLNAANEEAVAAFLHRSIGFLDIAAVVAATLERLPRRTIGSLEELAAIEDEARRMARSLAAHRCRG